LKNWVDAIIEKIIKCNYEMFIMNTKLIPMIVAIAAAAVILTLLGLVSESSTVDKEVEKKFELHCSGPICIRPSEPTLGEYIFIIGSDIGEDEKFRLAITKPDGKIWDYLYVDGSVKTSFNTFIKPDYSRSQKMCTWNDLVGLWTIELQGTNYMPLEFQHGPMVLEGAEAHYYKERNVCP